MRNDESIKIQMQIKKYTSDMLFFKNKTRMCTCGVKYICLKTYLFIDYILIILLILIHENFYPVKSGIKLIVLFSYTFHNLLLLLF